MDFEGPTAAVIPPCLSLPIAIKLLDNILPNNQELQHHSPGQQHLTRLPAASGAPIASPHACVQLMMPPP
jgi:hypothetical protein